MIFFTSLSVKCIGWGPIKVTYPCHYNKHNLLVPQYFIILRFSLSVYAITNDNMQGEYNSRPKYEELSYPQKI